MGRTWVAAGLIAGAILVAPQIAPAQPFADEHIRGTIESFDGQERLMLRDERGFLDDVAVGFETRIAPRGARLAPGARVAITGYNGGRWFDAVAIQVLQDASSSGIPSYAAPGVADAPSPPPDIAPPASVDPGPSESDVPQRAEPIILRATWAPYPVVVNAYPNSIYPNSVYPPSGTTSPRSSGSVPRRDPRSQGAPRPTYGH